MTMHRFTQENSFSSSLSNRQFLHLFHDTENNKYMKRFRDQATEKVLVENITKDEYDRLFTEYSKKQGFTHIAD